MPRLPGGPTIHMDTFARDRLPPVDQQPVMDYTALPELDAYPDRLNTAVVLLDRQIEAGRGNHPAMLFDGGAWTYTQFRNRVDQIAQVLVDDLGLVPGNRVLLRGPNNPLMAAAWLATAKAGGVCVATMPLLRARELNHIIDKAQVRLALCDVTLVEELDKVRAQNKTIETVSLFSAVGEGDADLDQRMREKTRPFDAVDTAADDVVLIAFTSGTTGQPKGTLHLHRDVLAMCDCFPTHVAGASASEVYTGTPPIAFTFGLGALLAFPLSVGASIAYSKPGPEPLLQTVQQHRCTTLYSTPTMFRALLDRLPDYDISSLKTCVSAGETLPKPTFDAWEAATGIRIIDGIGSTEMTHIFVSAAGADVRPGATGKAVPGYEARVVDDSGRPLGPGQVGMLAVRGPTGCRYLDNAERQTAYVRDGWNLPGDLYMCDEDGYFWYQSRADDMIVSSGYNISGPEVEAVLMEHDKVRECAVVASPDTERGHLVKAFIILRDPADANEALVKELQDFVKAEIAPYKYPRAIAFVEDLPRTETGKIQRFKLRQQEEERAAAQ